MLGRLEVLLDLLEIVAQFLQGLVSVAIELGHSAGQEHPDQGEQHHEDNKDLSRGGHQTSPARGRRPRHRRRRDFGASLYDPLVELVIDEGE